MRMSELRDDEGEVQVGNNKVSQKKLTAQYLLMHRIKHILEKPTGEDTITVNIYTDNLQTTYLTAKIRFFWRGIEVEEETKLSKNGQPVPKQLIKGQEPIPQLKQFIRFEWFKNDEWRSIFDCDLLTVGSGCSATFYIYASLNKATGRFEKHEMTVWKGLLNLNINQEIFQRRLIPSVKDCQ